MSCTPKTILFVRYGVGWLHVNLRTPYSSEGLIPRAIICYMGIDPDVLLF